MPSGVHGVIAAQFLFSPCHASGLLGENDTIVTSESASQPRTDQISNAATRLFRDFALFAPYVKVKAQVKLIGSITPGSIR